MRTIFVILSIFLTARCSLSQTSRSGALNRTAPISDSAGSGDASIPKSERTAVRAIQLAEDRLGADRERTRLISVEWSPANRFTVPQLSPTEFWPEADTEWSWFVTYHWNDPNSKPSSRRTVFRIREDGGISAEDFGGIRSNEDESEEQVVPKEHPAELAREPTGGKNSVEDWIHLLAAESGTEASDTNDDPSKISILRIRKDMLRLIIEDVMEAESLAARKRFLEEFLGKSGEFLNEFPRQKGVWLLRAIVANELERTSEGWDAGRKVWEFYKDEIDDPKIRSVLAKLERKGWLREKQFQVARPDVSSWTNSVGMVLVPIDETEVLVSIWETRVQDFQAFVESTGYDTGNRMFVVRETQLAELDGYDWRNPGYAQTKDHPVVGVSGEDAIAFCEWLTERERREGRIEDDHRYRLPRENEWSRGAGGTFYPWGNQWPLPENAGNYAGVEANDGNWPLNSAIIEGYHDAYPKTAPVGSFAANSFGLFDMGGNVWEWCEDLTSINPRFRAQRGASWFNRAPEKLMVGFRAAEPSNQRSAWVGFRCVLDLVSPADEKQ